MVARKARCLRQCDVAASMESRVRSFSLLRRAALAACAALVFSPLARAQAPADWPQHPVTFVMTFPAGSGVDVVARTIQEPLGKVLGQPVVIDYKVGAAGNVASEYVSRARPDGYTCLLYTSPSPRDS